MISKRHKRKHVLLIYGLCRDIKEKSYPKLFVSVFSLPFYTLDVVNTEDMLKIVQKLNTLKRSNTKEILDIVAIYDRHTEDVIYEENTACFTKYLE